MNNHSSKKILAAIFIFILLANIIYILTEKSNLLSYNVELRGSSNLSTQSLDDLGQVESLDLTVVCDNYPHGELSALWGVSILIETKDSKVLLDTGQSYSSLRDNSLALNKDLSEVDFVVISHDHWDHVGGLSYIEEVNPGVTVYVPSLMDSQTFNTINQSDLNVIKINETTIIQPGFAIIGELNGPPYEQALVVNVKDVGLVCFVGCSHPGVENLVEKATTDLEHDPYMVIGGFHMGNTIEQEIHDTIERLLELGVKKIFPIHCSGDLFRQYMADHYPQQYGQAHVGFQMTINIFTINPIVYFVVIPALIVSLTVLTGWFIRKKIKRSKASSN